MAGLSNIFGGGADDNNAENSQSTDFAQSAENAVGLNYSDNDTHSSQSADGSSESDSSSHDFGFSSDSDSLLSNATDSLGLTQEDSSN